MVGRRGETPLVQPYILSNLKNTLALVPPQMVFSHFGNFGYKPAPNLGSRA